MNFTKKIIIDLYKFFIQKYCLVIVKIKYSKSNISWKVFFRLENIVNFKIGENSSIGDFTRVYVEDFKPNVKVKSNLTIGKNTYIGEFNNIRAGGGSITIGDHCSISQFVSLIASNHGTNKNDLIKNQNWVNTKNNIVIEDDVWIGANSVILPGVKISKGSIIGAGSVVTKSTQPYSINIGAPSKLINYRK